MPDLLAPPTDESDRSRLTLLLTTERRVLELVARGRPLQEALTELTCSIEGLAPGMLASVLRLDADGVHLRHAASPSLPPEYSAIIDGTPVGPEAGSCGTAAFLGELVVASDIATDPRWRPWRDAALDSGLRACWSAPIFGTEGRILGTFALYYREPRQPDRDHLALIEGAAHVASLAIERHRFDEERACLIEDLSRAVRFSEMFVGVLGHDLRNPLGAIITAATLIQHKVNPDSAQRYAERILSSSSRINRMIEQLLDFTRIRLGKGLPIEQCSLDLMDLCREVADEIGAAGREHHSLLIERAGATTGSWDRDRLLQVISNLVGNAAQHGTPDHPISIHIDGTSADRVLLSVINDGEVPPALIEVLFDPLRRAPSATGKRQGLGLGLFISQQIVRAHGGNIEVACGNGSTTFTVTLPRADRLSEAPPLVTFDAGVRSSERPTVVLIEDDTDVRDVLADLLANEGYSVVTESSGASALDVIRRVQGPRVVVLDMSLPGRDGAQIYDAMRADPELAEVPVMVATADPRKAPPGVPIFRKPVEPTLLLQSMRRLFERF